MTSQFTELLMSAVLFVTVVWGLTWFFSWRAAVRRRMLDVEGEDPERDSDVRAA